jgi:hypothetical protein
MMFITKGWLNLNISMKVKPGIRSQAITDVD